MKVFVGLVLLMFFTACLKSEKTKKPLVSNFIKSEIERLNVEKPSVIKVAIMNGKIDTVVSDSLDWSEELNVFLANDVDSSQLVNYSHSTTSDVRCLRDTVPPCYSYVCDIFHALNAEEKIQNVKIWSLNQKIRDIEIIVQKQHELFTYYKKLIYHVQKGYEISGSQDIKFMEGINYKVTVVYSN